MKNCAFLAVLLAMFGLLLLPASGARANSGDASVQLDEEDGDDDGNSIRLLDDDGDDEDDGNSIRPLHEDGDDDDDDSGRLPDDDDDDEDEG